MKNLKYSRISGFTMQKRIRKALGNSSWKEFLNSSMKKNTVNYLRGWKVQELILYQLLII